MLIQERLILGVGGKDSNVQSQSSMKSLSSGSTEKADIGKNTNSGASTGTRHFSGKDQQSL